MSKLIVTNAEDDLPFSEYLLKPGRLRIGRGQDNDIVIDNHSVSSSHASIYTEKHDSFIHDEGSTNGTYVNGEKVKNHALEDSDIINIGAVQFRFSYSEEKISSPEFSAELLVKNGRQEGKKIIIRSELTTLGDPASQVAAINRKGEKYYFTHISSHDESERTKVNGEPAPTEPVELKNGDTLIVGDTTLEFSSFLQLPG